LLAGILILGVASHTRANFAASSIRFAVIGDFGVAGQPEADVAKLVKGWNPDFIITTGDNNYFSGRASSIDNNIGQYYQEFIFPYHGSFGAGSTANRFFPSLGNHDWETSGAKPYLDYFTLPGNERYYEFAWGPVHFFVIDSDDREPDGVTSTSPQSQWLQGALAASAAPWKIVYFHHPPYTSGYRGSHAWMQWPYETWGADVVLTGHAHVYERVIRSGFPYIVNGLGGAGIHTFKTPIRGSELRYNSDYGAMLVQADSSRMTLSFSTRTGKVIDTYVLDKAAANRPPRVDAGGDQSVTLPAKATLDGTVSDDGLPSGVLSSMWKEVRGPGVAKFADASAADTTVSFSQGGTYVLRLDASDGELSSCDEITVTVLDFGSPPDLAITSLSLPSGAGADTTITIKDTVKNKGTGAAGTSVTEFYLSADLTLDGGDILIGSRTLPALPAGATVSGSISATIPLETAAGVYYIIAKADGEDVIIEDAEENNIAARTIKVGPDLSVSSIGVPDSAARGTSITLTDTIKNLGAGSVGPSETHFYLSTDAKLDPKDRLLGRRVAPGLAPGKSNSGAISVSIPLDIAPATYYLIAKTDGNDAIGELSEGNNIKSKSIQIKP
jgi:hypothetical protein